MEVTQTSAFSYDENSKLMNDIASGLNELGLTQCQARVYCAVLKLPGALARSIAKECSLDRGTTYHVLEELVKLDLVKMELGVPTLYLPRNTERTINRLLGKCRI